MASYDAGSLTNKTKKTEKVYKELNLDFQQNSATKDIQKITDVEAVKRVCEILLILIIMKNLLDLKSDQI